MKKYEIEYNCSPCKNARNILECQCKKIYLLDSSATSSPNLGEVTLSIWPVATTVKVDIKGPSITFPLRRAVS